MCTDTVTKYELELLNGARLNNVQQVRHALVTHKVDVNTTNNVRMQVDCSVGGCLYDI